jgi:hypothetical protein
MRGKRHFEQTTDEFLGNAKAILLQRQSITTPKPGSLDGRTNNDNQSVCQVQSLNLLE